MDNLGYLKNKLNVKKNRVNLRYKFYEQKYKAKDFNILTPEKLKYFNIVNGWCSTAVDSLVDRLNFYRWENDNFNIEDIFNLNNPDIFYDSAFLSALISSCSFIVITPVKNDIPKLQVIDGSRATGLIDDTTGMLTEGYAEIEIDKYGNATKTAYFTKDNTIYYSKDNDQWNPIEVVKNYAPYPLLVPIINRPDAKRPFGHSRISRACMDAVEGACRTIKRSEIAGEYYSLPQKYAINLDANVEIDSERASASKVLTISQNEDGGETKIGQFQAASPQPFYEQLKMFGSIFAGETGLTLDDLGFVTSNPTSYDAIKASHENLRLKARKAQKNFGSGLLNVGYLAACVRDKKSYERAAMYMTVPTWAPIYEPDASQLGVIGDSINKINLAIPGYINESNAFQLTGIRKDS